VWGLTIRNAERKNKHLFVSKTGKFWTQPELEGR
jgi:hypothetical protein